MDNKPIQSLAGPPPGSARPTLRDIPPVLWALSLVIVALAIVIATMGYILATDSAQARSSETYPFAGPIADENEEALEPQDDGSSSSDPRTNAEQSSNDSSASASIDLDSECMIAHAHVWEKLHETVHHDAVTQTVDHPAEYGFRTICHTVCNDCGELIDNIAAEHIDRTGHKGYTINVPIKEQFIAKAPYTESKVVSEAYDEDIASGSICRICGVSRPDSEDSPS